MRRKRVWLAAFLLLALVVLLPSALSLNVFRRPVREALQRQLGRRIEFRALTARVLPRPGLVARGVVIHAREDFGKEPFLYAEEVGCSLPSTFFWRLRLECAQVNFTRPSINLVRRSDGVWNIGALLLDRLPEEGGDSRVEVTPPVISGSEARLNFKLGTDKQVFTLTGARFRLEPREGAGWGFLLDAMPRRTDRQLRETGRLRVQGRVESTAELDDFRFQLQAGLEQGSLAQLVALATGREPGVRAEALLALQAEGTPAAWSAHGEVTLTGLRRWDLLATPRTPQWESEIDLRGVDGFSSIQVEGFTVRGRQSEIKVTGTVEDPLGRRDWNLEVKSGRVVLEEILDQFASLKADVPEGTRLEGVASLDLTLHGPVEWWEGGLTGGSPILLHVPGRDEPIPLTGLNLRLRRGRLELQPLTMEFSPEHTVAVSGRWQPATAPFSYRVRWQSETADLSSLEQLAGAFGWSLFEPEVWEGQAALDVEWNGDARTEWAPHWSGRLVLKDARFYPSEFNQPLSIPHARMEWTGGGLWIDPLIFRLGEDEAVATLSRRSRGGPWTVNATAERLRVAALDELLNPNRRSLLSRLVGSGRSVRRQWKQVSLQGVLRVEELVVGPFRLGRARIEAEWRDGKLNLSRLRFRAYRGRFDGRMQAEFLAEPPKYRLVGNFRKVRVSDLLVDATDLGEVITGLGGADVVLEASGTSGSQLLRSLEGRVVGVLRDGEMRQLDLMASMASATDPELAGDPPDNVTRMQSLAGDFRIAGRQVEFDEVRIIVGGAALKLTGRVGFDGRLDLRLNGEALSVEGRRPSPALKRSLAQTYRLRGTLHRPKLELLPPQQGAGVSP